MTSCIDWPRTASGDCSPSAHSTASVMLDFPEPLGPTITLTPSPKSRRVRSGKDLNPLIVIDFRCMQRSFRHRRLVRVLRGERFERTQRSVLFGQLLAASRAVRHGFGCDDRRHGEGAVVRRALLLGDLVGDRLAATRELL